MKKSSAKAARNTNTRKQKRDHIEDEFYRIGRMIRMAAAGIRLDSDILDDEREAIEMTLIETADDLSALFHAVFDEMRSSPAGAR